MEINVYRKDDTVPWYTGHINGSFDVVVDGKVVYTHFEIAADFEGRG